MVIAGLLEGPAALLLRVFWGSMPTGRCAAATCFIIGALLSRYAWIWAGRASAHDPDALFQLQRKSKTDSAVAISPHFSGGTRTRREERPAVTVRGLGPTHVKRIVLKRQIFKCHRGSCRLHCSSRRRFRSCCSACVAEDSRRFRRTCATFLARTT